MIIDRQLSSVINDTLAKQQLDAGTQVYKIRDVWTDKNTGVTNDILKAVVASHDVLMIRLIK